MFQCPVLFQCSITEPSPATKRCEGANATVECLTHHGDIVVIHCNHQPLLQPLLHSNTKRQPWDTPSETLWRQPRSNVPVGETVMVAERSFNQLEEKAMAFHGTTSNASLVLGHAFHPMLQVKALSCANGHCCQTKRWRSSTSVASFHQPSATSPLASASQQESNKHTGAKAMVHSAPVDALQEDSATTKAQCRTGCHEETQQIQRERMATATPQSFQCQTTFQRQKSIGHVSVLCPPSNRRHGRSNCWPCLGSKMAICKQFGRKLARRMT